MEEETKYQKIKDTAKELMPKLPYHNYGHALDVYSAVGALADVSRVGNEDRHMLRTAALLHDIIMVPGAKDNEERSAEFAGIYLPNVGYSGRQIGQVGKIILATKMPQKPNTFLEQLICDADLDNLGRPDFLDLGDKVREELGIPQGTGWYQSQLKFLKMHSYHTEAAKSIRDNGKLENIELLERMLREVR